MADLEELLRAIYARTNEKIVIYTQVVGEVTAAVARAHAKALYDQWVTGGGDDGLVILVDLKTSNENGQVQLYAGKYFMRLFANEAKLQAMYDQLMKPLLVQQRFDGAFLALAAQLDHLVRPEAS